VPSFDAVVNGTGQAGLRRAAPGRRAGRERAAALRDGAPAAAGV